MLADKTADAPVSGVARRRHILRTSFPYHVFSPPPQGVLATPRRRGDAVKRHIGFKRVLLRRCLCAPKPVSPQWRQSIARRKLPHHNKDTLLRHAGRIAGCSKHGTWRERTHTAVREDLLHVAPGETDEVAESQSRQRTGDAGELPADEMTWLARVLELVLERTGVDFSGYRLATLLRRVRNRMIAVSVPTLPEYFERLRDRPAETDLLVERLTIKVSRFFRHQPTFEALRHALEHRAAQAPARRQTIWSAGCGHGQEPYSLAILLGELKQPAAEAADVIATDIDANALKFASEGCYSASSLDGMESERRSRCFDELPGARHVAFRLKPALRRQVTFRFHDLTAGEDAPENRRFDLVACRNVLIYLERPLQERVQHLLVKSLLPGGLLCLGEAEWLLPGLASRFDVVDRKARLFRLRAESCNEGIDANVA